MSSDFKIDIEQVSTAGKNLTTASETLKNGRTYGDATGAEDYEVYGAVSDFRDKWDNALTRLQKSIGDMGQTVSAIATAFQQDDQNRSQLFKTEGGGQGASGRATAD